MNEYEKKIKSILTPERFRHSLGVAETAARLAKINGADEDKAYTAGILHDAAKNLSYEEMLERRREYGVKFDETSESSGALLHAPLGAEIAKREFGISDDEILESIRSHTVARENMSTLDKIIYIADMIEPNRNFDGVEEIRAAAFENLDRGVLMGLEQTILHTIKKGLILHPSTVYARNSLIALLK